MTVELPCVSLFSSGGIGDLGLRAAGLKTICANELLPERASLFRANFSDCDMIAGNIYDHIEDLISVAKERLNGEELFLILATPPCQGMSSNGLGKLLSEIRKGNRPKLDSRNSLILPTLDIVKKLNPRWVIFENVTAMRNTVIEFNGELTRILDVIDTTLTTNYAGKAYDVDVSGYGVPQKRTRLITVYTRDEKGKNILRGGGDLRPEPTHDSEGKNGKKKRVSVLDAIGDFPPLDAKKKENAKSKSDYLHQVPVLDEEKYFWVSNTPINETAFNNQCVNKECGYQNNPRHGAARLNGINQSKKDTPVYCVKCGSLLPRPWVKNKDGKYRIMKGFISAYKRMDPQAPSPTLTTNFTYTCSDNKIHPTQNRVLSLAEACVLQSISKYDYSWETLNEKDLRKRASITLIRDVIGESVPPYFTEQECRYVRQISEGEIKPKNLALQLSISNFNP